MRIFIKTHKVFFFILFIIIAGGCLRFYNLNWDNGYLFHPDEDNIANAVSEINFFRELNPHFFAYGGFLIYLYKVIAIVVSFLGKDNSWQYSLAKINLIGRFSSALFSTFAVFFIYLVGARIFNKRIGLIASFLSAFTVGFIQEAHFSTTESLLILLSVMLCFFSLKLLENSLAVKYSVLCALVLGVSVATKLTGLSFGVFPMYVYLSLLIRKGKISIKRIGLVCLFLILALVVFLLFSPFTVLDWRDFISSIRYESAVATGTISVFYTLQFKETPVYLFQLKNFFWQMGPVSVFGVIGFVYLFFKTIRLRDERYFLFVSFPTLYFLYVGSWYAKFVRYMIPIMPFLLISAAYILERIYIKNIKLGLFLISLICLSTFLWALAFLSIYKSPQTRIAASSWIYVNIPPKKRILTEEWDYMLPLPIGRVNSSIYDNTGFDMYSLQDVKNQSLFIKRIADMDYIILASRRMYKNLMRLNNEYPFASRYYKLLQSGKLGFRKVAEFSSYPSLFGIVLNDDASEETFQVFDHPKVIIFKNGKRFSIKKLSKLLNT